MAGYRDGFSAIYDKLNAAVDYGVIANIITGILVAYGKKDGLLLDLACGTGALSVLLAQRGYEVIGADASPAMLSVAAARPNTGKPVLWLCQPMEQLDLYGTVGAAVCTMDSLNHLSGVDALAAVFARLRLFVEPGGLFLFDMNTPYKHREVLGNSTFSVNENGVHCRWRNHYEAQEHRVAITLDYSYPENGVLRRGREAFSEFACDDDTVQTLLENNGFSLQERRGGYPFDGAQREEVRHLYVAQRGKSGGEASK